MKQAVITIALSVSAFCQVPVLTGSMYERDAPELKTLVTWLPVMGATSYNVYEADTDYTPCNSQTTFKLEHTTTDTFYLDSPNPFWWQIPVTGSWRDHRFWCYSVSSDVDSSKLVPVEVVLGNSGYLSLYYYTACTNGHRVIPFPYLNDEIVAHFYYNQTEIPVIHFYNSYGGTGPYNEEWEWKLPVLAADGTLIPWPGPGRYTYTVRTPDGGSYSGSFMPPYQNDMSYYNQVTVIRVLNGPDCPVGIGDGGNYSFWQNVTRR